MVKQCGDSIAKHVSVKRITVVRYEQTHMSPMKSTRAGSATAARLIANCPNILPGLPRRTGSLFASSDAMSPKQPTPVKKFNSIPKQRRHLYVFAAVKPRTIDGILVAMISLQCGIIKYSKYGF
ncbi:hypothetical protein EVAR_2251_1 [Eumeta japonica]|uniref:Uncharacterized protein n=1 Tax=Eumeta variegata TaxID=151549 RepID=A0A4C1SIA9_EUMVA|nr:hypothetical protein EVAR_2251_1 [Eumeta japonica]